MKFRLKVILESDIKKQVLSFDLKVVKMALDLMLSGNWFQSSVVEMANALPPQVLTVIISPG